MEGSGESASALAKAALEHLAAGRAAEAVALLERAIAIDAQAAACHANLGVALQTLGRLDEATAAYERAIAITSEQLAVIHFNRGTALAEAGKLEEAVAAQLEALRLKPQWTVALDNLGTALQRLGRTKEAEHAYVEAVMADPGNAQARCNLGTLLCGVGRYQEALALYRQVIAETPGLANGHAGLGAALAGLDRSAEAIAALRRAIELDASLVAPYRQLAGLLSSKGAREEALAAAEKACELKPNESYGHSLRGEILLAMGRRDEAEAAYLHARDLAPHLPEAHVNAGHAVEHRDLEAAVASYREALARDPSHGAALTRLASALTRLGRNDEAVTTYRRLIEVTPDHPAAPHLIDALSGETTAAAPRVYVSTLFDGYAARFDKHMRGNLEYRVPALVHEAVTRSGASKFARALDLGCGTGLVGAVLRGCVGELHGIDLSAEMIRLAREKNVYDRLDVAEIVEHLAAAAEPRYDLVTAGDVLCYVGDLGPILAAVRARLERGGLFVFTIERLDGGDVKLWPSGRYSHGRDHVLDRAARAGYEVLSCAEAVLRLETRKSVAGWVCALRAA